MGRALAIQFAKHRIEVMLANSRRPSTLTDLAGTSVRPVAASEAISAGVVLAIPFGAIPLVTQGGTANGVDWSGRLDRGQQRGREVPAFKPADLPRGRLCPRHPG
ncbi:hypothetical protein FJ934_15035 [Mesorhizobium sp. B2-4-12]|nr:hypothetical protein FJ934_15035 [Mesorhizobium sp. B2-4-12]